MELILIRDVAFKITPLGGGGGVGVGGSSGDDSEEADREVH